MHTMTYIFWTTAQNCTQNSILKRVSSQLAAKQPNFNQEKSTVYFQLYGRLNLSLVMSACSQVHNLFKWLIIYMYNATTFSATTHLRGMNCTFISRCAK